MVGTLTKSSNSLGPLLINGSVPRRQARNAELMMGASFPCCKQLESPERFDRLAVGFSATVYSPVLYRSGFGR
jgi:hypothetical protein